MQEIKHDGSEGVYKEGTIDDLLPEIKASLEKDEVKHLLVSSIPELSKAPHGNSLRDISETKLREIIREEFKLLLSQEEPLFKKILKEINKE